MENYKPRIIDKKIEKYLSIFGAICIEGPKWCGKTWSSSYHSNSEIYIGDPSGNFQNRQLAQMSPSLVLEGEIPRLIDEWQDAAGNIEKRDENSDLGGTMRLGAQRSPIVPNTLAASIYGESVNERHRHRYEVNNAYRKQLEEAGLVFSGLSPDRNLVEFIELPTETHPFFVATQAHPEFKSRPITSHPLFKGLIAAAVEYHGQHNASH